MFHSGFSTTLFLTLALLSTSAFAGTSRPSLLHIFCDEISRGATVPPSETILIALRQRLERRERTAETTVQGAPLFEECIRRFESEFIEAEFIRGGVEMLEGGGERRTAGGSRTEMEAELFIPEMGVIRVGVGESMAPSAPDSDRPLRQAHYERLWKSFLARIVAPSFGDAPLFQVAGKTK